MEDLDQWPPDFQSSVLNHSVTSPPCPVCPQELRSVSKLLTMLLYMDTCLQIHCCFLFLRCLNWKTMVVRCDRWSGRRNKFPTNPSFLQDTSCDVHLSLKLHSARLISLASTSLSYSFLLIVLLAWKVVVVLHGHLIGTHAPLSRWHCVPKTKYWYV